MDQRHADVAWAADDRGFFYSRFPQPPAGKTADRGGAGQKVYFHKLGDPQSADKLIYERPDHPNWTIAPLVMEGGRYLLLYMETGVPGKNLLAYQDLRAANPRTVMLIPSRRFWLYPIAVIGSTLYLQTNDGAPRGRVIAMDIEHPERANWKEIVPERAETLDSAQIADGKLLLSYMKDAHSAARLVSLDGKAAQDIAMPGIGTAGWSGARLEDKEMFYGFEGFTIAPSIYRLDLETGKSTAIRQSKVAVDLSQYETKQVFYSSKDGTRVPMFLSYKKGLKLDGAESDAAVRLWRVRCRGDAGVPARASWNGCRWAACMRWRIFAADRNMAKRGTRRGCAPRSRTCLTISSRRANG